MALLQGPALYLPTVLCFVPLGLMINRYSRVRLLFVFTVLSVVVSACTALSYNFTALFFARCLVGLAAAATSTIVFSIMGDLYPPAQRGRANTVVVLGQVGGMSAAFALGGALLVAGGERTGAWSWTLLWLCAPLIPLTLALLLLREPPRTEVAIANPSARVALTELWRYRSVIWPLLAGSVMIGTANMATQIWAAPVLSRTFALAPDRIGAIMATVLLLSGVAGSIAGGVLADLCHGKSGPRRTMWVLSGLTFLSAPAGLFALAPGVASATAMLVAFMTTGSVIAVAVLTLCTVVIPNELRGLCLGVLSVVCAVPGGFAPVSVSLLSNAIGGPTMIGHALAVICLTISVFGAATAALGSRYFPRTASH
jgi:MFS family permease